MNMFQARQLKSTFLWRIVMGIYIPLIGWERINLMSNLIILKVYMIKVFEDYEHDLLIHRSDFVLLH